MSNGHGSWRISSSLRANPCIKPLPSLQVTAWVWLKIKVLTNHQVSLHRPWKWTWPFITHQCLPLAIPRQSQSWSHQDHQNTNHQAIQAIPVSAIHISIITLKQIQTSTKIAELSWSSTPYLLLLRVIPKLWRLLTPTAATTTRYSTLVFLPSGLCEIARLHS